MLKCLFSLRFLFSENTASEEWSQSHTGFTIGAFPVEEAFVKSQLKSVASRYLREDAKSTDRHFEKIFPGKHMDNIFYSPAPLPQFSTTLALLCCVIYNHC